MDVFDAILGDAADPETAAALHRLDHRGRLDSLVLPRSDLARRRLRARTEAGAEVAVALPRSERLFDGAVLRLDEAGALVVRVEAETWLRVRPENAAAALTLGYHAGNLHWRVRFDGDDLLVAVEGPEESYRARLEPLTLDGRAIVLGVDGAERAA